MKWLLYITACLVAMMVAMSVYPGVLASTIFSTLGVIFVLPLLGLWFLFVGVMAGRDIWQRRSFRTAPALQAAAMSLLALGLVVLHVPMRIGFAVSRPAFERFLRNPAAPEKSDRLSGELSRWFGIYHTDRWGIDARGGTYFRTGTGVDFIDEFSSGFVLQPNHEGTPFGAGQYDLTRIAGEWYMFSASDDYY